MDELKTLGGTSDILPQETLEWQAIEQMAHRVMALYGYSEIRTPIIEEAAVFARSLGEANEIVTKQMYLFQDRGGRSVALRPEGTAAVVRALIEHGLDKTAGLLRFYYLGPMFRSERPQAGRRRQFHQIGVEVFGSASPYQDVEVICLLMRLLRAWGLKGLQLKLNSLGCQKDQQGMRERLAHRLAGVQAHLCEDCRVRLEKNPLRILDCKEPQCRRTVADLDLWEEVCHDCRTHFDLVMEGLSRLGLPFERDPHLVRGLDYYTKTAFEVIHTGLGAQNALGGGGRYDNLVAQMGGTALPAVGFAVGLERVLMARRSEGVMVEDGRAVPWEVFVATVSSAQIPEAMALVEELRDAGIPAVANLDERPIKRQFEYASKWIPKGKVLVLGEDEIREGVVTVKDMSTGRQEAIPRAELLSRIFGR
jgi:histidyl-tRNA synthetase